MATLEHNDSIPFGLTRLTHEPISVCGPTSASSPIVEPRFGDPSGNDLNPGLTFENRGKPTLAKEGLFLPPQLSNGDGGPDNLAINAREGSHAGNLSNQFPGNTTFFGKPDGKLHAPLTIAFNRS